MEQYTEEKHTDDLDMGFERFDNKFKRNAKTDTGPLLTYIIKAKDEQPTEITTTPKQLQNDTTHAIETDGVLENGTLSGSVALIEEVIEEPAPAKKKTTKTYNKFLDWNKDDIQTENKGTVSNYFLMLPRGVITNPYYIELFSEKGYQAVYNFLWSRIVRLTMRNDRYKIVEKYHKKNKLSCTYPIKVISRKTGLGRKLVLKIINVFEHLGIIKIDEVATINDDGHVSDKKKQNIYTLGEWKEVDDTSKPKADNAKKPEETLFLHGVFLAPKL